MVASAAAPADGRVEKRRLRPDVLPSRSSAPAAQMSCALARLRSPLYCYRVSRESEVAATDTTVHRGRARYSSRRRSKLSTRATQAAGGLDGPGPGASRRSAKQERDRRDGGSVRAESAFPASGAGQGSQTPAAIRRVRPGAVADATIHRSGRATASGEGRGQPGSPRHSGEGRAGQRYGIRY